MFKFEAQNSLKIQIKKLEKILYINKVKKNIENQDNSKEITWTKDGWLIIPFNKSIIKWQNDSSVMIVIPNNGRYKGMKLFLSKKLVKITNKSAKLFAKEDMIFTLSHSIQDSTGKWINDKEEEVTLSQLIALMNWRLY